MYQQLLIKSLSNSYIIILYTLRSLKRLGWSQVCCGLALGSETTLSREG